MPAQALRLLRLVLPIAFAVSADPAPAAPDAEMSELSAIAEAGGAMWAVGDETNDAVWRIDPATRSGAAVPLVLPASTAVDDLEGLTAEGGGLVAVCSQSLTKKSKKPLDALGHPKRECLVRLRIEADGVHGTVASSLRDALIAKVRGSLTAEAAAKLEDAPDKGGLNLEGMAHGKGGLLLGLRSPVGKGGALVVPLSNAGEMLDGGAAPELGAPLVVPAKPGEGIRAMAEDGADLLLVLGPTTEGHEAFRLVRWNPETGSVAEAPVAGFAALARPEGIAVRGRKLWVVQDLEDEPGEPVVVLDLDAAPN